MKITVGRNQRYKAVLGVEKDKCVGCVAHHNLKLCFIILNVSNEFCQRYPIVWEKEETDVNPSILFY